MSSTYRLLAVDVDGTLMNSRNELPDANREALHRAHAAGMTVSLCTGRSLPETQGVIDQLGLDSDIGIFVFGAIVSRLPEGRTLERTGIAADTSLRLVEHFQSRGYPVLVLYDREQTRVDYQMIRGRRHGEAYQRWMALAPTRGEEVDRFRPNDHTPVRIGIILSPDEVAATTAEMGTAFRDDEIKFNAIFAPNYRMHVLECFAPQVSKWHGISRVMELLRIDASQVVAIGDDVNDLEMIRHAGLSVAMGNAVPAVRRLARWLAPDNDACGVAVAIDTILSGGTLPAPEEAGATERQS